METLFTLMQTLPAQPDPASPYPQYFVGWGTLALINAGLAQAKGRSGLAWFLISLLLGRSPRCWSWSSRRSA